jgi:hypothetical protein
MHSFERFLLKETLAVTALNAGINAAYTSWLWQKLSPLSVAGPTGIAIDLATTPVFIGFLSTLLGTTAIRKKLAAGAVAPPRRFLGDPVLRLLPMGIFWRAAVLATLCAIVFAMPLQLAIVATGITGVSLGEGVAAKVAITVLFSFAIVPIAVLAAGTDRRSNRVASSSKFGKR